MKRKIYDMAFAIMMIAAVSTQMGCKKSDELSSKEYYIKFVANGERFEYRSRVGAGIDKQVDDDGRVHWAYNLEGGQDGNIDLHLQGSILNSIAANTNYINLPRMEKVRETETSVSYVGNLVTMSYVNFTLHSNVFVDGGAEIKFNVLADDYIKGTFSGVVYSETIMLESGEVQGVNPVKIEQGEFYTPITMGQWPYK